MSVEKEIETYFGKCKCCFKYGYLKPMWEKHVVEEETEIYGQMLTQCFAISWKVQSSEDDDQICEDCVWKLREASMFKKQVLQCQEDLERLETEDIVVEVKCESDDEEYEVEYLEEEVLDNPNCNKEESEGDCKDILAEPDALQSQGDEDEIKDEDYVDESQDPPDTDEDDKEFIITNPRKRRPRKSKETDSDIDDPKPKWPKKLPKEERSKTYRQYSMEGLKSAVEAVTMRMMNQKEAAKHYQVPRKTLSDKVREARDEAEKSRPLMSEHEENEENQDVLLTLKKHRENIHSVLAYSNATPIKGYSGMGYDCAFCPDKFIDTTALKKHTKKHSNLAKLYRVAQLRSHAVRLDVTGLKCTICDEKQTDLMKLMHHLKDHDKPMHFDIKNHIIPFKFDTKVLQCAECSKQFGNFKFLSEHMSNEHYRNYVCVKCNRGFVNKTNLMVHKDTHETRGSFGCNYCGKIFGSRKKRTTHERNSHAGAAKAVQCRYCRMSFADAAQKEEHETRTHQRVRGAYRCSVCPRSYARQRALHDHVNKDHLLYRPYECTLRGCDKSFYLNTSLQAHILAHDNPRPFHCELCSKTYPSKKALRSHFIYMHSNKEFKCPVCDKYFVLEDNLTKHLKEKH